MKCKRCGEEINLMIVGMPKDICYGCLTKDEKLTGIEHIVTVMNEEKK